MIRIPLIDKSGFTQYVLTDDILYITVHGREVTLHTEDNMYRPPIILDEWEQVTSMLGFRRLERAHLVQLNKIISYSRDTQEVNLGNGIKVPVSRRNTKVLDRLFP